MLNPFIDLLANLIDLYMLCLFAWVILSLLIAFKIVNAYQTVVQKAMYALDRLCQPALKPIQKLLPNLGGIDVSPVILLLLLNFAKSALYTYFYNL